MVVDFIAEITDPTSSLSFIKPCS